MSTQCSFAGCGYEFQPPLPRLAPLCRGAVLAHSFPDLLHLLEFVPAQPPLQLASVEDIVDLLRCAFELSVCPAEWPITLGAGRGAVRRSAPVFASDFRPAMRYSLAIGVIVSVGAFGCVSSAPVGGQRFVLVFRAGSLRGTSDD